MIRAGFIAAAIFAATLLASGAFAAPNLSDEQQPPAVDVTDQSLPVLPAFRPPPAPTIADLDGNGLSDGLEARLAGLAAGDPVDVVVTFTGPGDAAAAQQAVGAFGLLREFTLIDGFAATMSGAQARALAGVPGVFRVEEDVDVYVTLESARPAFGVDLVYEADPELGGLGITGARVGICIVDTGIMGDHEQFMNSGGSKVYGFYDFVNVNGVTTAYDDHGHGTHVAGIAAGDGTGAPGAGNFRGVAPDAVLYGAKVLDSTGSGPLSDVIAGIEWCWEKTTADIISLSLGTAGSSDGQDSLSLAVNAVVEKGVVTVVAAGNAGAAPQTVGSPGAAIRAITVGAVAEPSPSAAPSWRSAGVYPAPSSSRGPTRDGRVKPDIMAPGVTVASAAIDPYAVFGCGTECYTVMSGTSMATPFVSGTVALMMQAHGGAPGVEEVRQILFATAQPRGIVAGKDNEWGFGLLDAFAAVRQAQYASPAAYSPTAFPEYNVGRGTVPDNGVVRIPINIVDPSRPLAVAVTIDGKLARLGWKPDLEAILLDSNGAVFGVNVPFFGWIYDFGTISTCPAGAECGAVGRQETLHRFPAGATACPEDTPDYFVEVWPFEGFPNKGKGGSFTYELSNGRTACDVPGPGSDPVANAGPDRSAGGADGIATVELDGSASGPFGGILSYTWSWTDAAGPQFASGIAPLVELPLREVPYDITLTVTGIDRVTIDTDVVAVTVERKSGGGKGNGRGPGPRSGGVATNK